MLPKIKGLPNLGNSNLDWLRGCAKLPKRGATALRYILSGTDDTGIKSGKTIINALPGEDSHKHISFTFAAISLSALVARADGNVTKEEYLAFRDSFPLTGGMCGKIRQLFLLACQSQTPFSAHVQQIKSLFPQQIELYISLVERLFRIATADKPLSREEERILAKIARLLGLNPAEYSVLHERYSRPLPPHIVLGVQKRSPRIIIKKHYHILMNRYHPDRYAATGVSPEVQMLLTLKTSEISQAYRALTKKAA